MNICVISCFKTALLPLFLVIIAVSADSASAQDVPENLEQLKKQVPTKKEALQDQAEFHAESHAKSLPSAPGISKAKHQAILKRIKALQKQQASYLAKLAKGEIKPNAELADKWPKIQQDVFSLRKRISALNNLAPDDRRRPQVESELLAALSQVGEYLLPADHPPQFEPHKLDKQQVAEMQRIESAIANIDYGPAEARQNAKPVELIGYLPYTLINLPVPITLKSEPNGKIYLTADTGGSFSNGLSLIELATDNNGIAQTTWESIGEAVATCHITVFSKAAIEPADIQIEVVSPSLPALAGLPKPPNSLLTKPDRLKIKFPQKK